MVTRCIYTSVYVYIYLYICIYTYVSWLDIRNLKPLKKIKPDASRVVKED